jgi:nitroimidazol reductase NimA-like FMN-containing flavoprotein (pyridoxamine 5'-phosphate oxidase superfamily)
MREIRRKEKAIKETPKMKEILSNAKYITIAMCNNNEPYLVTLSHGYDPDSNVIYFHCAIEGKKIDFIKKNNVIWGQALIDKGYVPGKCDHLYATTQFRGKVSFINDFEEKRSALINMLRKLEDNPEEVINEQITEKAVKRVCVGKIIIDHMSGKESKA